MGHLLVDACLVDSVWAHYLFFRAQAVDDEWLKEKMAFSVAVNNVFNSAYRSYLNDMRYFADEPGINFLFNVNYIFNSK